ncbi:hypothetical protein BHM03_00043984 [Ensete ventricosum]|nr:hypothetical protein BHM03_00043984 [Ensete ventricosum]
MLDISREIRCALQLCSIACYFVQISSQKKKTGVISPRRFVQRVKKQNELFRSYMHQVSHFDACYVSEWVFFLLCWGSLQEAQKRMKIKKPPSVLVIHLKRFKYIEHLGRNKKLSYRVVFPMELKLMDTVEDPDTEYSLFAVVVHIGTGPNHGHYVSLVKSHNHWLYFDDETVEMIDESSMHKYFGSSQEYSSNTEHGYILFYESLGKSS